MENQSSSNIPAISVIMGVKNGQNCLHISMDSILQQTFSDWEMIICDDGSIDNTNEILNEYAKADSRIRIIRNDTSKGLAYSLDRCIELSQSDVLARQDADDRSALNRFELQYAFVMEHPEFAIVGTSWFNVDSDGNCSENVVKEDPTINDMIPGGIYMHPSWMMRKQDIAKVEFYTANEYTMRSQDYHLVLKLYGEGLRLHNMQECLYYYTADAGTFRRSKDWKHVKGLMWIRFDGYRRNHVPFYKYVYVLKPLLVNLIPQRIMNRHYRKTMYKKWEFRDE